MSASNRGTWQRKVITWLRHSITIVFRPLLAGFKSAVVQIKAYREQKRRISDLRSLNDHVLQDIGLLRDRFTGTVLNGMSGEVLDRETRRTEGFVDASAGPFGSLHLDMIERRGSDRRIAERRRIERRSSTRAGGRFPRQDHSSQDRRAFDRRSSDHQVLDCRCFFPGRPGFLLA